MDLEDLFSSFIFGWFKDMKFSLQKYIKLEKVDVPLTYPQLNFYL